MSSFAVNIVAHTLPAVSVIIADSGVPSLSYAQLRNSIGHDVYNINGLYIYSSNLKQLTGIIQYNMYDTDGNQRFKSITTAVDAYQHTTSLNVDLKNFDSSLILNGNSNLSTTILAGTYVQLGLHCTRVRNSDGLDVNNFELMQQVFRADFFTEKKPVVIAKELLVVPEETNTSDMKKITAPQVVTILFAGLTILGLYLLFNKTSNG